MGELYAAAGRPIARAGAAAPPVEDVAVVEEAERRPRPRPRRARPRRRRGAAPPAGAPRRRPPGAAAAAAAAGPDGRRRDDDDDVEGARLIALNMALNGQSREETDKYLAENFDLSDRAALLDEVYATVEG